MTTKEIQIESPLEWPEGLKRTKDPQVGTFKCTFGSAFDRVRAELRRMGIDRGRFTATMLLRNDGLPYASQPTGGDPAVAVYFTRGPTEFVLAIDRYRTLASNTQAVAHILTAYRTIERHGGRRLAVQALEGFRALKPGQILALPAAPWWRVLGFVEMPSDLDTVLRTYRKMLRDGGHPDHGAPPKEFAYASQAVAQAREHFARGRST